MGSIIPDNFNINGDLTVRFDRDSLFMMAAIILLIVILSLLAQKYIKNA